MIDFENDRRFQSLAFSRGVEIPKWALLQILTALPDDAILFHSDYEFRSNQYHLVFWSSEFDHVPYGFQAPTVNSWVDRVNLRAGLGDVPDGYMIEATKGSEP